MEETDKEYTEKKEAVEELRQMQARYENLGEKVQKVNEMLPSSKDYPKLLVEVPALMRASGMSYENLDFGSPQEEEEGGGVKTHEMSVELEGSYAAFKNNFLYLQQRELRLMDLSNIEISAGEEELGISVSMQTYYQP